MTAHYFFDRQGQPMTRDAWAAAMEDGGPEAKRVASTVLSSGFWVSTVWVGIHDGSTPPRIFETMVFPCDVTGVETGNCVDQDSYSTEAEALAGHAAMVIKWARME